MPAGLTMPAARMSSARLARPRPAVVQPVPLALLALGLLAGCSPSPEDPAQTGAVPSPPPPGAASAPGSVAAEPPRNADLTPLPTPQAVLREVPIGRADPFAPLQTSQKVAPSVNLPSGFRLRGVLRVSGRDQAFVQTDNGSGVVCVGPRGLCGAGSEPLLPKGSAVVAIQPRVGCIIVAEATQRKRYCLQES